MKNKKKKAHRHRWVTDGDSCNACGAYEKYCKGCETIALCNLKGKIIDIAQ
jgi:hypothetical protein